MRGAGAEALVNYERDDLKVAMKELTGRGADVVIDPVGGPYSEPPCAATRSGGRFVVVGSRAARSPGSR